MASDQDAFERAERSTLRGDMQNERTNPRTFEEIREAILDQLGHLIDEVEALRVHVDLVPKEVLSGRPTPDSLTFKELYALLATFDQQVFTPAVDRLTSGDSVHVALPAESDLLGDTAWNERSIEELLDGVKRERRELVGRLRDLPSGAWDGRIEFDGKPISVMQFAHWIVQHDAAQLRIAAFRLYESRLTSREEDLPK